MISLLAKRPISNTNGWQERHNFAVLIPHKRKGEAIVSMIKTWAEYADGYEDMYPDSMLGDDCVLGAAWQRIGEELRTLLNGNCGRLDCGTLDGFILDTMRIAGVDTSKL